MRSPVLKWIGSAASLFALCLLLGGNWGALQCLAWTRMLIDYSRADGFSVAVGKTFDGNHPCPMCLKIRAGRQEAQRDASKMPWVKQDKMPEMIAEFSAVHAPAAALPAWHGAGFVPHFSTRLLDSPPKPPPRTSRALLPASA